MLVLEDASLRVFSDVPILRAHTVGATAVLLAFIPVGAVLPDLVVGAVAAAIVLAVAISDPFLSKRPERTPHPARARRPAAAAKNR
jgi:hypothetical protein